MKDQFDLIPINGDDIDPIDFARVRDQRNRAWAALYQIKKAMPMLAELLDVLPTGTPEMSPIIGKASQTGEFTWDITNALSPNTIKLAALVGATMDVISEGLPEEYTDEETDDAEDDP